MQLTFTFDTANKTDLSLLNKIIDMAQMLQPERDAQPEVAQNTGTTGTGVSTLSTGANGVSAEEVAPAASSAAPDKPKRTRKAKEEVAADPAPEQPEQPEQPEPEAAPEVATNVADPATFTLDEVRAALQQFTAAKGVPAGIELLKKFNAGRISELAEDDYASFVAECQA